MTTMTTVSAPLHCQGVPRIADLFHSAGSGKNKNTYLKQSILFLFLFFYYTFFVWFFFLLTKSRKTIRRGIDFSNEPTGNAKFMSPPASGQSMIWCKDKKADFSLVFLFFFLFLFWVWICFVLFCFWRQEPWLLLGIVTHLLIFRKKRILSVGEAQASDLLLGALIKGLS